MPTKIRKLKIAQLGPAHPHRGGIVHFNNRLAQALQARQDVEVQHYFWSKPYPKSLLPGQASDWLDQKSRVTLQVPGRRILSYTNPWSWWKLLRHMRSDGCDVLVTHWVHPVHFPVFLMLFAAIRHFTDIRIHLIVHNVIPHETFIGAIPMTKIIMNMAHHIIVHSSAEFEIMTKTMKIQRNMKISFHPTYDFFPENKNVEDIRIKLNLKNKIFLFFGFIRPYKGIQCLVSAFEILLKRHDDISLLIVGENLYSKNSRSSENLSDFLHDRINTNENIIHIDAYVPNEDVGLYFSIADVLVTPYIQASQSGPVHIASAFGKPVIASDLPAFRECIKHGVTGYLFTPGDPQELAKAMEHFLEQTWDSNRIRAHGQRFDWDRYVEILLDDDAN